MKHHSLLPLALVFFIAPFLSALRAAEQFTLEPKIYVFKNSDLPEVAGKATSPETKSPTIIFKSPATIQFARESLTLDGAEFRWSNGGTAPANINPVSAPPLKMTVDQPVTLRCASSAQYMERLDTGGFQLRAIAPDSPDAPRYVLTFSVRPAPNAADSLLVSCTPEIATVQGRDKIAGVELEIGKPVMAVFKDKLEFTAHLDEWVGILFRSPNEGDYSVLTLLKISRDPASGVAPKRPTVLPVEKFTAKARTGKGELRSLDVVVRTDVTPAGEKLSQPSKEHPAYYLAYDAGYKDLIPMNTRDELPTSTDIDQTLRGALATQGYQPASSLMPPSLVIICYRIATGYDIAGGNVGSFDDITSGSLGIEIKDRVLLSVYDYKDLCRHERTLIWRIQLSAWRHDKTLREAQSTLIAGAGIKSGAMSSRTFTMRAPLLDPNPAEDDLSRDSFPFSIPKEFEGQIDEATVRRLIKNEWVRIAEQTDDRFLPISDADKSPHISL